MTCITAKRLGLAAALALSTIGVATPANAQIRALLPTIDQVEPLDALEIDGQWEIREIGKRIVIEGGHAFADDSWVHMLLFRIEPNQVVLKNIRELADGDFVAHDLPLMAGVRLEWVGDDTLRARTDGLVPVIYHLDRVDGFGGDFDDFPITAPPGGDPSDDFPSDDGGDPDSPW